VLIGRAILGKWQDVHLFNLVVPLLLSFIAIQSCFFVLRRILKPSRALHVVERVVSWLVWIVFALHLTGYLDEVVAPWTPSASTSASSICPSTPCSSACCP
jgi:hypothetical protein